MYKNTRYGKEVEKRIEKLVEGNWFGLKTKEDIIREACPMEFGYDDSVIHGKDDIDCIGLCENCWYMSVAKDIILEKKLDGEFEEIDKEV